jgi:hypothetical protein
MAQPPKRPSLSKHQLDTVAARRDGDHSVAATTSSAVLEAFLSDAQRLAPAAMGKAGKLVFALDATMSRQPTWDLATKLQGEMFHVAGATGGLMVQLVYFRGFGECRASSWVADARALTSLMTKIECRGGHTQIGRVLKHIRQEAKAGSVRAFVLVGDAMEESIDDLCALAGELGLMGIKGFLFQEGRDAAAHAGFREVARLTHGVHMRFDGNSPERLSTLLRAAAAYAGGGLEGLRRLATREEGEVRKLLIMLEGGRGHDQKGKT